VRLRFHAEARAEFLAAADWYGRERLGLGEDFIAEVGRALDTIRANPEAWPVLTHQGSVPLRRFVLARFPYGVIFTAVGEQLFVIAVAHGKRRPGYWRNRVRR
jgi:toxin ParE1/3/4